MRCSQCGNEFEGNFCPECGARAGIPPVNNAPPVNPGYHPVNQQYQYYEPVMPPKGRKMKKYKKKKPFFLRWWFILLVIIGVIAVAAKIRDMGERIPWKTIELRDMIPEPPAHRGTLHENNDECLNVSYNDVSDEKYNKYLRECIDFGYTVDSDRASFSYKAYNADGYHLYISHISDHLSLELESPMELGTIVWPDSSAGKRLPAPKSSTGSFSYEHDDSFYVYVGDTSKTEYSKYVSACSDAGFNLDYSKDDTYYSADDSEGWHVKLEYIGNSIMSISIEAPDEPVETAVQETAKPSAPEESVVPAESELPQAQNDDKGDEAIDPDFKAAMDSYEEFMDEYVAFMKKYSENSSDLGLLADYMSMMSKYTELTSDFEKWEDADLNPAETAYYLDVQMRVTQKLLEAAG